MTFERPVQFYPAFDWRNTDNIVFSRVASNGQTQRTKVE
jgi:hypothetical protein